METLEQELMDQCDAKEVAHDLPESVSIRDLKALLPSDFCEQVHISVSGGGYLSEHQWRSGPVLMIRFIMGPEQSALVQIGENVNRDATAIAEELDEAVKARLPAEHKDGIQVWHHRPVFDRWNEQWVFETLVAAADKVLEESVTQVVQPTGLSEDAARAWHAIVNILHQEGALPTEKIIFTAEEWQQREGERLGAELVVLHENGDHCPYFNLNFHGHLMHAKMDLALREAGFRMESQSNGHSAIYKVLVDDEVLVKLNDGTVKLVENDEDDFGDQDRDVFEPGGSAEDRIRHLFQNAGLHIKNMVEIPADPGWGDLGKPKQTIESVLQPDESRPWSINPIAGPELSDFRRRIMSNLGEILGTTDIDFTTRFDQGLGAWEIKWYIGMPEEDRSKLRENVDEFEGTDDNQESDSTKFQPGDRVRCPDSPWPDLVGVVRGALEPVPGQPDNMMWYVEWPTGKGCPEPTSSLELVERPQSGGRLGESDDADFDDAREVENVPPARTQMPSGVEGWQDYLQQVYSSFEEFEAYDEIYGLAARFGFDSPQAAWEANPLICGSVNPSDSAVVEDLNDEVVAAAQEADREPSDEQKEAGNYQKGHVTIQGLEIAIENAKGSMRRGKDKDGKEWEVKLPAHYGYIKGTEGKDKDHIDVFIGEDPESEKVFVVNQDKLDGGLDEHKVMLGFTGRDDAIQHYDDAYSDGLGKKLRGSVVSTTMEKFKAWLKDGNHKVEYEDVKLAESLIDEVFAYLKSIEPQMEQAKQKAADEATDPEIKESILKGHGSYVGTCGHRLRGCRCSSKNHPGRINVEAVCRECSKGNVQESVDVTREAIQEFLDWIKASEQYNEEEGYHHLPDGTQTGTCTNTACMVAKKFGGRVVGYHHADNPTAKLGENEGGHDFVVIGNRWLVDWWAKNVTGDTTQEIFDFQDPNDAKLIAELYGEPSKWKPVENVDEAIVGYHASPNKFKTFDTSKEGAHFGTHEQASNLRKSNLRKPIAYSLDIKNPVRLHDIGVWNNFNNLHGALSINDHITPEQADAVWAAWLRSDAEGWEALKAALEANGYDGIVYQNEQEGPGDSYIALRAGQIHRLKESITEGGKELKLAQVVVVNSKSVPVRESEEEFDEPELNDVAPEHEWKPVERPKGQWCFVNKQSEVALNIRNDGGGSYYFSLAIPGSVFNVVTSQYASDEQAIQAGLDWANRDPVFLSRVRR